MKIYELAPELTPAYIAAVWETLPRSIRPTLLLASPELSALLKCDITIASETFQYTGSFKFRAAYNLLSRTAAMDIVTASSGNFGQAVAYACRLLGKTCTVVMPDSSARVKVEAVRAYGGLVELIDVRQVSRAARVAQYLADHPQAFWAQAYDDYHVVAGNSTLGKEIFQAGNFDAVIVPIGGGGLCSGIVIARFSGQGWPLSALKRVEDIDSHRLPGGKVYIPNPHESSGNALGATTEIIGAEPQAGNDAARSFRSGQLLSNEQEPATIADGARVLSLGKLNWEILRQGLTDIIEVPDTMIVKALQAYFLHANLKVEPTGALALGALFAEPERFAGKRVCCIASGGNVDPAIYRRLL